ncbi:LysR family transcriptional regulator substrate-binding protein [Bacillus licheniformis]|nr:LysR family transcriptional regulator substrate-binding protein [Bacillus licheniformis]
MYPNLMFNIWEGEPSRLSELLESRQIDAAVTTTPIHSKTPNQKPAGGSMQACSSRESVVWLKRRSRNERNCRPAADSAQAVARKGIYDEVVHHFQSSGLEPRVVCECHDSTTLLSLVTSGFGATILPLSMLPAHLHGMFRHWKFKTIRSFCSRLSFGGPAVFCRSL